MRISRATTTATFVVTLLPPSSSTVTVDYATMDGSATTADNDYQPTDGMLSFSPEQTSHSISVTIASDLLPEHDETFSLVLSNAQGAAIGESGTATIRDDDANHVFSSDFDVTNGGVTVVTKSAGTIYIGGNFSLVGRRGTGGAGRVDAATGTPQAFPQVLGAVYAIAPDGSGGWYLGGRFGQVAGVARSNLAHVQSDGTVSAWDPGANGSVRALVMSGGTMYVGGSFTSIGGQARNRIAALDAATGLATAWNPGADDEVWTLAMGGGVVYAGGSFSSIGGQARDRIAALDVGTGFATSWDPSAPPGQNTSAVLALAPSGGVVFVGGVFDRIGGKERLNIAALDTATGLATNWNPSAWGMPPPGWRASVFALAVGEGIVYAGGSFSSMGGQPRAGIAAVDAATGLPTGWSPAEFSVVGSLTLGDGIVYAGGVTSSPWEVRIAAIDVTNGQSTAWNIWAVPPWYYDPSVYALALDGTNLCAGGSFDGFGMQPRSRLAALDAETGKVTGWKADTDGNVGAIAVSGSTVYVGGTFATIGGQARNRIAAIDAATGVVAPWNPNANGILNALAVNGGSVYAGGSFTSIGGQARNRIAAIDAATGLATAWNAGADGNVWSLAVSGTVLYAGGEFTSIGGQLRNRLAALDLGSGLATAWNPGANGTVLTIVPSGTFVYAGGQFTSIGGQIRNHIAAIHFSNGDAMTWNPDADQAVRTIVTDGSIVYAGGDFYTSIGGQPRRFLAALDPATGLATPWNPQFAAYTPVYSLALGEGVYVGGSFSGGFAHLVPLDQVDVPAPISTDWSWSARLAPNPARGAGRIEYVLPQPAHMRISVFDVQGRLIARPVNELRAAGRHVALWDLGRRGGLYFVRCEAMGRISTLRLVVFR